MLRALRTKRALPETVPPYGQSDAAPLGEAVPSCVPFQREGRALEACE